MGWTTPTTRSTGDLITASIWNTDLVDDLAYLKGQAGTIELESGIVSDTDITDDLGSAAAKWREIHGRTVFGSRMRVNPNIREVRINWNLKDENANSQPDHNVTYTETGGGSEIRPGGTGQITMKVDNDAGGARSCEIENETELNNSLDNAWTVSKNPYMRLEFSLNAEDSDADIFIGFRTTPDVNAPTGAEVHAGLLWTGIANWQISSGDGTTSTINLDTDPTAGARNIVEIYVTSTSVEIYLNGVLSTIKTTNPPTGTMEWHILLDTDGGGSDDSILTLGQLIFQEEP